jgi:L-aspartate oxidase
VPCGADDVVSHVRDTLTAGRGLCEPEAVQSIIGEGMNAAEWLRSLGMCFDAERAREGGHARARILHREGDRTGAYIMQAVGRALSALPATLVVLEGHRVLSLSMRAETVTGVWVQSPGGEPFQVDAQAVILATGGLGRLYVRSTNPPGACGEGVALAFAAGAVVRDMEFVQFHPTALPDGSLVTEAVRGAGARLINAAGDYFMARYDSAGDLAPRDVVARAVLRENTEAEPVRLDLRGVKHFAARFPGLVDRLHGLGYQPLQEPIPVAPAAHYAIGGVETDLDGRTTVPGLYAAGEVASTGLHGANRLASNSMLEALVMGRRAAFGALEDRKATSGRGRPLPVSTVTKEAIEWLPGAMESAAGVLRDGATLVALEARLSRTLEQAVEAVHGAASAQQTRVARLIVRGAQVRAQSLGVHWRSDATSSTDLPPYHLNQWCTSTGEERHGITQPGKL